MKKVIFYHVYLYGDNYMGMIAEQFSEILSSGLYRQVDKIYIGVSENSNQSPANGVNWIRKWWTFSSSKELPKLDPKVEIVVYNENNELIPTLKAIRDYAKDNPEDYIMFFHTKGITKYCQPTEDWRRYMEYFCLERWKDCIAKLDEGFGACGVMWNSDTVYGCFPHFSGAFYWATSKYINTLDDSFLSDGWRYSGEFWIGTGEGKIYEFHNSGMNNKEQFAVEGSHYSKRYPRENYYIPKKL